MTQQPHSKLRERVELCRQQIVESPYSHTIAAGWYAEDVPGLLEQLETLREMQTFAAWLNATQDFLPGYPKVIEGSNPDTELLGRDSVPGARPGNNAQSNPASGSQIHRDGEKGPNGE